MTKARFPVLDTVRGLAFMMVVLAHMGRARGTIITGVSQFGVWIFFVLSAFLLSRPFFEEPGRLSDAGAIKSYFWRRARRIFPPLAAALVAFGWVFPEFTWQVCVQNFLCLRVYGIFWTVFVETRYYLLLPLVVAAVLALKSKPGVLIAVLAAGLALHLVDCPFWLPYRDWRALSFGPAATGLEREHFFLQYLPVFIGGTLLAALHLHAAKTPDRSEQLRRIAPYGFVAALLGFAALSAAELGVLPGISVARQQFLGLWLPTLPLSLGLVYFGASLTGISARFFGNPLFRFFGRVSYSGYLFHYIFVRQFDTPILGSATYVVAVLAATLATATLSHYLIERPFLNLFQRPKAEATAVAYAPSSS